MVRKSTKSTRKKAITTTIDSDENSSDFVSLSKKSKRSNTPIINDIHEIPIIQEGNQDDFNVDEDDDESDFQEVIDKEDSDDDEDSVIDEDDDTENSDFSTESTKKPIPILSKKSTVSKASVTKSSISTKSTKSTLKSNTISKTLKSTLGSSNISNIQKSRSSGLSKVISNTTPNNTLSLTASSSMRVGLSKKVGKVLHPNLYK